jgi:hypothetical protein
VWFRRFRKKQESPNEVLGGWRKLIEFQNENEE